MLKTVAFALLAASALAETSNNFGEPSIKRGRNNGLDNENAAYCDMISNNGKGVKVDLFTYMQMEFQGLEWHGETKLYLKDLPHVGSKQIFEYGFCMRMTEAINRDQKETYDCSSVKVKPVNSADGKKVSQNYEVQFFNNMDYVYEGTMADFSWAGALGKMKID